MERPHDPMTPRAREQPSAMPILMAIAAGAFAPNGWRFSVLFALASIGVTLEQCTRALIRSRTTTPQAPTTETGK